MSSKSRSPNQTNTITAIDSITGFTVYPTATNNKLDVNATASLAGTAIPISGATTAVGVAIVDDSGNQISSFGGGTQYADGATQATPTGTVALAKNSSNVLHSLAIDGSGNLNVNVAAGGGSGGTSSSFAATFPATGTAIGATDGTNMQPLKVDGSDNLLVKVNTALPAGTNVIGHVITDTGSTTAVTGTVTISGTVTASAGTNLNTSLLALESGGNLATLAGAVTSSIVQSNVAKINNVTPLMGNGITGTGSQRVTIASDNTAFSVNATLSAETTKIIGTVNISAAQTIAVTNAGTFAVQDTVLDAAIISQEATTSGVKGLTAFGAVTTNAPTYTTAKSDALSLDTSGLLRISLKDTPANTNKLLVTADAITIASAQTLATVTTVGTVTSITNTVVTDDLAGSATGSAVPANAMYAGLLAQTANPSAASAGNLVGALSDKVGKQVVVGSIRDLKINQITTITSSASETTVLTQVASTFLDVYGCIVTNTSATAVTVAFKDSTSGTTQFNIAVPAGDTRGFMLGESAAIKQTTINNNWTATTQSVSSVIITMLAVKNI